MRFAACRILLILLLTATRVLAEDEVPPGQTAPRLQLIDIAGVYAIRQDKSFDPKIYDLNIAGVSLRTHWSRVEPRRGDFDWSLFDNALEQCAARGKTARLSIMFGSGVPKWVGARWFVGSSDSEYDTANQPMPVPWDEKLMREQDRIIRIFAQRYRNHPQVAFFHIAGPSSIWEELALPKNIVEQQGYSQERILKCWKQVIDLWQEVRGNKRLSVSASAATSVYRQLGEDIGRYAVGDPRDANQRGAVGSDFCMQWNYLDTLYGRAILSCSQRWHPKTMIAWQMWGSTQWNRRCQDFHGTIKLAMDVGSSYVEIYQDDLLVPGLAEAAEELQKEMKTRIRRHGRPAILLRQLPRRPDK